MTKVLLGIIIALVVALGIAGWFLKHDISKLGSAEANLKTSQANVRQLNRELAERVEISKITDDVVDTVGKQNQTTETKISTIKETVKKTAEKEKKGEITPATASSVYIDSMWRAYCEAGIPNPRCSTR